MDHNFNLSSSVADICRYFVQQSEQPVIAFDEQGNILLSNHAAQNFFKSHEKGLVGSNINELFPSGAYERDIRKVIDNPPDDLVENSITLDSLSQKRDGTQIPVTCRLSGYRGGRQLIFIKTIDVCRDIINRERAREIYDIVQEDENYYERLAEIFRNDIGATLASAKTNLEVLAKRQTETPALHKEFLDKTHEQLEESIKKVRSLAHTFPHGIVHTLGLTGALRKMILQMEQEDGCRIDFYTKGIDDDLPVQLQRDVFRIIEDLFSIWQEQTKATDYNLQLIRHADSLVVKVACNSPYQDPFAFSEARIRTRMKKLEARLLMNAGDIQLDPNHADSTEVMMEFQIGDWHIYHE